MNIEDNIMIVLNTAYSIYVNDVGKDEAVTLFFFEANYDTEFKKYYELAEIKLRTNKIKKIINKLMKKKTKKCKTLNQ